MAPIEKKGFLGTSISGWIGKIRAKHLKFFELADETNELCQSSMFELEPHSKHLQELLAASLFLRSISGYQATILLAERGMMPESRVMARTMLETIFSLCAIQKEPKLANDYAREDQHNRLKFLNKFKVLHGGNLPDDVTQDELVELENELKQDIGKNQSKVRSTEQWAEKAGMHDWYLSAYAMLSMSVHTKVRDLEDYMIRDNKEEVREFQWGPSDIGIQEVLMTAIEAMLVSLNAATMVFKMDKTAPINSLHNRLQNLVSVSVGK
jgi:hypothetical protein